MESDSSLAIFILVVSLTAFAGVCVSRAGLLHIRERGDLPWASGAVASRSVHRLISRYQRIDVLFLLLMAASILAAGLSIGAWTLSDAGARWGRGTVLAGGVLLSLVLIQSAGRVLGQRYPKGLFLTVFPVLLVADRMLSLLLRLARSVGISALRRSQDGDSTTVGGREEADFFIPVEEEVREADAEERRMIQAILRLEDVTAREVMVPRVDIVGVEVGSPLADITALMADGGHSRIPIYEEGIDNVVGIIHARDVLKSVTSGSPPASLTDIARPATFIPDSKPLDELLREFQEQRVTVAVVVDEYGGTAGLITVEDMLEEIVGEIEDEFARAEPPVMHITEEEALVDGRVNLDELNEIFQTNLRGDGFDTLGGLLSTHLGKIPVTGDAICVGGLDMRVVSTTGRRVRKVRVIRQS